MIKVLQRCEFDLGAKRMNFCKLRELRCFGPIMIRNEKWQNVCAFKALQLAIIVWLEVLLLPTLK